MYQMKRSGSDANLTKSTSVTLPVPRSSCLKMITSYGAYNILQSSKLCSCHEIQFPLCSTTPKTAPEAKQDLCLCLCEVLADDSFYCAVYTLPPYSVLFCQASTGKIMLVDTQTHVTLTDGHSGGAFVCARRDETTVSALTNWLFNRMKLSGDVCHKLAVLKPVISKSCQQNACDVNDQFSLYLQCTDSISPCRDNILMKIAAANMTTGSLQQFTKKL
jgi:hypothetical protein